MATTIPERSARAQPSGARGHLHTPPPTPAFILNARTFSLGRREQRRHRAGLTGRDLEPNRLTVARRPRHRRQTPLRNELLIRRKLGHEQKGDPGAVDKETHVRTAPACRAGGNVGSRTRGRGAGGDDLAARATVPLCRERGASPGRSPAWGVEELTAAGGPGRGRGCIRHPRRPHLARFATSCLSRQVLLFNLNTLGGNMILKIPLVKLGKVPSNAGAHWASFSS